MTKSAPCVSIISLGCSKNLVDSERLARLFEASGIDVVFTDEMPARNSFAVVNTCGFIGDAKEESVNTLLELIQLKESRYIRGVYAMGCLTERYRTELTDEMPELDGIYGKFDWKGIVDAIGGRLASKPKPWERVLSGDKHYTYIKISEGCNRFCAFCAIPLITGRHHSRQADEILEEVGQLAASGTKEFNIIAQDLSSYGRDLVGAGDAPLADLLDRMAGIKGVEMIRLHYAYPADFPYAILPVMASHDNICKYLDIALQHIDDKVLSNMRRHIDGDKTRQLLERIRTEVPGIHIRTTLMTGFPGETDEAFRRLVDFVKEQKFERMGAFAYCEEEGTFAAENLEDSIDEATKQHRLDLLMEVQHEIGCQCAEAKIGRTLRVIVDGYDDSLGVAVGRTEYDSPEVDCMVYIENGEHLQPGDICNVVITSTEDFDLRGHYTSAL